MVKSDIIDINGKQYRKTYSDSGFYIERDGMQFSEAVDFIGADFVYTCLLYTSPSPRDRG